MTEQAAGRPGRGWLGRREMAEALGVSEQHFDRYYRPMVPKAAMKKDGRRWWFKSKSVFEVVMANKVGVEVEEEEPRAAAEEKNPDDARYRRVKAELAELELRKRRGELVELAVLNDGLMRLAQILRTCGEILGREYGVEAQRVIEDGLKTFGAEVRRICGDRDGGTEQG